MKKCKENLQLVINCNEQRKNVVVIAVTLKGEIMLSCSILMSYNLEISVQTEVFKNTHLSFLILGLSCFFCRISVKC